MSVEALLDTNVLVYAATGHGAEEAKRLSALELIDAEAFGTSAQILGEFWVTVRGKVKPPLEESVALEWIDLLRVFPCAVLDSALVAIAIDTARRFQISYWDAAILAAAHELGAKTVYSEDFQHGRRYGPVRVVNPFR